MSETIELGEFRMSRRDEAMWVDHADPRIMISAELIDMWARGELRPEVTLDRLNFTRPNGHVGAVIRIDAANRTLVYRLAEYLPSHFGYIAEWPD